MQGTIDRWPMLWIAGGFGCGALLGTGFGGWPWALVACAGVAALGANWASGSRLQQVALLASAVALGAAGAATEEERHSIHPLAERAREKAEYPALLAGALAADVRRLGDQSELLLDVDRIAGEALAPIGRARIRVYGQTVMPSLIAGARVRVWARLFPAQGFASPGAWDAQRHALRRGIHAQGVSKSALLLEVEGGSGTWSARARSWARQRLGDHVLPGPELGLVRAMVLGDRTGVAPDAAEAFRIAGTYHVLALSGAQVALVVGLLLWMLGRAGVSPVPVAIAVCGAAWFYALFVGGDVPVVRAVVMAAVLIGGRALDLDGELVNLLGVAAFGLLVYKPSWIGDVGFQLSFGATLGILVLAGPLSRQIRPLPLRLEFALAASIAAQMALVPLLMWHFNRLAPAALLMNLVAGPLASAVLLAGFAVLAVAPAIPWLADFAGDIAWAAAHVLLESGEWVRDNEWLDVRVGAPTLLAAALYLTGLFALADERRRKRAGGLFVAGVLGLILAPGPDAADGRLRMTVLDVGQGDSIVLHSPTGRVAVIDAGARYGDFDLGERVVVPYLRSHGVRSIDHLFISHAHGDHVGGMPALARSFDVGRVWEGPAPTSSGTYQALSSPLSRAGIARTSTRRGAELIWDGVRISVVGPSPGPPSAHVRNDDSLVLLVRYGAVGMLLTGDIEATGERLLEASQHSVVKVPHHGSRTSSSSDFLNRVRPELAIISAGSRNRFGHPHPAVVERYRTRGVRLLRTDRDGSVTIATDGQRLWLESFNGTREAWRSGSR